MRALKQSRGKPWLTATVSIAILIGIAGVVIVVSTLLQGPTATEPPNAAEWLSAVSTFWGAIATAIGAIVTAGALLIAAMTYRRQVADRHQVLADQHRAQAASVTVGSRSETVPSTRTKTGTISLYFTERKKHFCFVRNDSLLPIYRVELSAGVENMHNTTRDVLAPGDEEVFEVSFAPLPATARFTDSAGSAWKRESSGLLTEIGADYDLLTP